MYFEYQALNKKGENITDIIDASNVDKAKQTLRSQGLYVVKIKEHHSYPDNDKRKSSSGSFLNNYFEKINSYFGHRKAAKLVAIFSRQLATLLKAGLPLIRALTDILEQTDNAVFKQILADIIDKIQSGVTFSNSLARHNSVFSEMYINMVKVGENLGSLDTVIERLAEIEEKRSLLKNKVQSAMLYPLIITIFFSIFIVFLLAFIIPNITNVFDQMGKELPLITQLVIAASTFFKNFWFLLFLVAIAGVIYFNKYKNTVDGRRKIDELKMKLPIYSRIYNKMLVLKFTQNLGILLSSNVDLLKSFEITKKIVDNVIIEEKLNMASVKIKEGTSVSKSLISADFLPKMVLGMISAGEASDNLDTMLLKIGEVYDSELDMTINSLTGIIEPVIIIVLGLIIGTIVIAIALPLINMNTLV